MIRIDMDMPKNCYGCRFIYDYFPDRCSCTLAGFGHFIPNVAERPLWCPLKPDTTAEEQLSVEKAPKEEKHKKSSNTKQDSWDEETAYYRALDSTPHEMGCW